MRDRLKAYGLFHEISEPTQKITFSAHVDRVNNVLRMQGHGEVEGDVVMAAAIAWGDVAYRLPDMRRGQITEVSLDPLFNTGRAPSAVWRKILTGEPLCQPLPPRGSVTLEADRAPRPRVLEQGADGSMHEIAR
jgi:hypothetical protein